MSRAAALYRLRSHELAYRAGYWAGLAKRCLNQAVMAANRRDASLCRILARQFAGTARMYYRAARREIAGAQP